MIWGGIAATAVSFYDIGPARAPAVFDDGVCSGSPARPGSSVPLWLRVRWHINEIIITLLLNYVALNFLLHLLYGPWLDPKDNFPHSPQFRAFERLPELGFGISSALVLALLFTALSGWLVLVTRFGFFMKFVQNNDRMALAVGVPIGLVTLVSALLSGALSGLAGFVIAAAQEGRLTQSYFEGYGFSGILIAFLARSNPVAAMVVAIFVAILFVSGRSLQVFYQIPFAMVQLIQAIIVISVAASEFFMRHRCTGCVRPKGPMLHFVVNWLAGTPSFATPYALAALGLIISERAGVLSLGAEGFMLVGALAGVATELELGGYPGIALLVAMLAAAIVSLLFAFLVVFLRVNQVIAGLVVVFFCHGLTSLFGTLGGWTNRAITGLHAVAIWPLSEIPIVGKILFTQDVVVYLAIPIFFLVNYVLTRSMLGLRLRSVGENPEAADAAGIGVSLYRLGAVLAGSALIGLAGGYLSVVDVKLWIPDISGGRGWIAIALGDLCALAALARPVRRSAVWLHRGAHSAHRRSRDSAAAILPVDDALSRNHRGDDLGGNDKVRAFE